MNGIERLHEIMTRLRDPEKGCPWDKVQTLETLKPCVLEETYELLAAMDHPEDAANHVEELGDVLLQVMFQCVMAEQEGRFSFPSFWSFAVSATEKSACASSSTSISATIPFVTVSR